MIFEGFLKGVLPNFIALNGLMHELIFSAGLMK